MPFVKTLTDEEARERARQRNQDWKKNNPERNKELKREYYRRNKEAICERTKARRQENIEDVKAKRRAEYASDKNGVRTKHLEVMAIKRATDEHKQYRREYWSARRVERLVYDVRKRCKAKGIECDLTTDWVREKFAAGICEMTGIEFDMCVSRSANSPSIDRIEPAGPYTKENCRMILWSLNRALSNHGEDYMFDLFRRILEKRGLLK